MSRRSDEKADAERALAETEERYRAVVENTTAIILRVDPLGVIRFANQRALDFFGYCREDLIGRPAVGTIIPVRETGGRDLTVLVDQIVHAPDRFHSNANENIRKNGERVWVEWTNSGIYDEKGVLTEFLAVGIDATDRRRAEEEIQAQWRLFETVVYHIPAGVNIVRASDMRVLIANPAYRVFAPGKDMVGRTMGEVWPELPEIVPIFREVTETGRSYSVVDSPYEIRRSDDGPLEQAWFSWSVSRIALPGNEGWGLLNTAWETTKRKRTEQALADANARLTEADRRKDEFLAMLGHELRNPLAVIEGAMQLMRSADLDDGVLQKARAAAERQSQHMARLVDELLDVSRITQGKVTLAREELNLRDLVEDAVDAGRPLIEARGQRLFLSVSAEQLRVLGDPVRLSQALGNLLNNAAKYTPANGEIRVLLERERDEAVIVVRDNGVGIAADLLPHIFDLFVQGERGSDRAQGGLGIGLTLARRLVEMHGGRIDAESDGPGRGSRFTIALPLLAPAAAVVPEEKPHAAAAVDRRRVLVVDDNEDGAEMLALQLQAEGHEAVAVHSGAEALDVAPSCRPDIAFVDIGMPGMDGYELARRLRRNPILSRTILVALTGYGQEEDIERSRAAGFDAHLVKPADIDAVRRMVALART